MYKLWKYTHFEKCGKYAYKGKWPGNKHHVKWGHVIQTLSADPNKARPTYYSLHLQHAFRRPTEAQQSMMNKNRQGTDGYTIKGIIASSEEDTMILEYLLQLKCPSKRITSGCRSNAYRDLRSHDRDELRREPFRELYRGLHRDSTA